jgi:hypothetical protein
MREDLRRAYPLIRWVVSPNDDAERLTHFEYTQKYTKLVMPSYDERQLPVIINFFMHMQLFD